MLLTLKHVSKLITCETKLEDTKTWSMKDVPFVELTKIYGIEEHCKVLHKTRFCKLKEM